MTERQGMEGGQLWHNGLEARLSDDVVSMS